MFIWCTMLPRCSAIDSEELRGLRQRLQYGLLLSVSDAWPAWSVAETGPSGPFASLLPPCAGWSGAGAEDARSAVLDLLSAVTWYPSGTTKDLGVLERLALWFVCSLAGTNWTRFLFKPDPKYL